ncbi:MAG: hypothetical protein IPP71_14545 [Bacteroidetes bacterium]|nr:hypothetical protein [Bacteroidota bacterium]
MEYQLDATLCGVPDGGTIDPEMHQMNFVKMLDELSAFKNIEVFFDSGRKADEKSYVWLENKVYKGFGYIQSGAEPDEETLLANLTLRQSSITTENIIKKLQETAPPSHTFQNKKPRQLPGLDTSNLIQHQLSYSSSGIA